MNDRIIVVLAAALLGAGCTRENTGYDPSLVADGGAPPTGDHGRIWTPPTPDTAPATACPAGATACQGTGAIRYCKEGAWRADTCAGVCAGSGYHYAVKCAYTKKLAKDACLCGHYAGFGELCDDRQVRCAPGLFCGIFSGGTIGVTCPGDLRCDIFSGLCKP